MPQTTTDINACDAVVKIDNSAGNLQDISGSANSVEIRRLSNIGDGVRTFGAEFRRRHVCGKDAEITLRVVYSQDELEAVQLLNDWYENHHGTFRTFQVDVPDSNPGGDRYTFEVHPESISTPVNSDDANPILVEVALKPTGTFTWAEIGS